MKYQVQEVVKLSHYRIWKKGKVIREFSGPGSYEDAHEYVQDLVEDDRWHASNRD